MKYCLLNAMMLSLVSATMIKGGLDGTGMEKVKSYQENELIIYQTPKIDQNPHELHQAMMAFYNTHIDLAAYAVGIAQLLGLVVTGTGLAYQILAYNQGQVKDNVPKVNMAYAGIPGFDYYTPSAEIWTNSKIYNINPMKVLKSNTRQSQIISVPNDQLRHLLIGYDALTDGDNSCLEAMSFATDFGENYRGFNGVLYFDLPMMIMIHSAFFPDHPISSQGYGSPLLQGCFYAGYVVNAFDAMTIDLQLANSCTLTKKPSDTNPQQAYRRLAKCLAESIVNYCRIQDTGSIYNMPQQCVSSIQNYGPFSATLTFT